MGYEAGPGGRSISVKKKLDPPVLPPIELSQHYIVAPEPLMGRGKEVRARVLDETEIDRMLMADRINLDQHNVLEEVLRDFHDARMIGSRISRYEPTVPTSDPQGITDRQALSVAKIGQLQRVLDRQHGVRPRQMVVNLVTTDTAVPTCLDGLLHRVIKTVDGFYLNWSED